MVDQNSDLRQTGGSAGMEQTGDRFRETRFESDWRSETFSSGSNLRFEPDRVRAGRAAPEAEPLSLI